MRRRATILINGANSVDVASETVALRVIWRRQGVTTALTRHRDGRLTASQRGVNSAVNPVNAVKLNGMNGKKVRNTVVNRPKKRFFLRNMVERYER